MPKFHFKILLEAIKKIHKLHFILTYIDKQVNRAEAKIVENHPKFSNFFPFYIKDQP